MQHISTPLSVSAADPSEEPDGGDGYGKATLCMPKSSSQVSKGLLTEERYTASHQRLRPVAHFLRETVQLWAAGRLNLFT